ncbi:MAG: hypothetical protein IIT65_07735 [Lachnospiraceae bacterium]|jgi:regulator of replication initiation timing|nr:hypothetical protein [Lachnospiraceae bacterium]
MDIKKYIKNKDIEITNEDIDITKLENDLRKGYELSSDVESKVSKAVEEANAVSKGTYAELEKKYNELQTNYDDIEKRNTDITERNRSLALENVMTREGFKDEDFKDISSMRYSMYGDIKDDKEAISKIKEKFQNTYFPTPDKPQVKDDLPINNGVVEPKEPAVNRKTSIKDLLRKK